jgi:hypothetical protein
MHHPDIKARTIAMCRAGASNAEIARKFGMPAATVGTWKFRDRAAHPDAYPAIDLPARTCPRCDGSPVDSGSYSYLLGLYLGDGCISAGAKARAKGVWALRIACANAWPGLIATCESAIATVMPGNRVCRVRAPGMVFVTSYSRHWPCLFPQHGAGVKHLRKIELADWQRTLVEEHPWEFIRGLIHSDGCRITNWTERPVAGERKRYEYIRYFFTNTSPDIRDLYCWALDMMGVEWRYANRRNISVAKKASVAVMDLHVGPKF